MHCHEVVQLPAARDPAASAHIDNKYRKLNVTQAYTIKKMS